MVSFINLFHGKALKFVCFLYIKTRFAPIFQQNMTLCFYQEIPFSKTKWFATLKLDMWLTKGLKLKKI